MPTITTPQFRSEEISMNAQDPSVLALYQIASLPIALDDPVFTHYSRMKMGVHKDLDFFAEKLADRAYELIEANPQHDSWVLTAPHYHAIPAAANFLCQRVHTLLQARPVMGKQISMVELQLPPQSATIHNAEDYRLHFEYSRNTVEDRIKERELLYRDACNIVQKKPQFEHKAIIVINDIKVTGTQQKFMLASFDRINVATIYWLYILEVDAAIGLQEPHIEHSINHAGIRSMDELKDIINNHDISYTARCMSTIFTYEIQDFGRLLNSLSPSHITRIYRLASNDETYNGEFFREKLSLLKNYCENSKTTSY